MHNKWLSSTVDTYLKHYGTAKNPITVYDVGSRDGDSGYELSRRISNGNIKDANIVLFECNPVQIEAIKRKYPNATLITEAISDVPNQEVDFLQLKGDMNVVGSSSMDLTRIKENWVKDYEIIKVKTRRLDDVIESLGHQDTEIDILKMDIEHYSMEGLLSMGKYLRNCRVLHVETEPEPVARKYTNLDVALFMQNNGFKMVDILYEWGPNIQDQVYCRID